MGEVGIVVRRAEVRPGVVVDDANLAKLGFCRLELVRSAAQHKLPGVKHQRLMYEVQSGSSGDLIGGSTKQRDLTRFGE